MGLFFAGKVLSCIAATGTIGAVAVLPKVRTVFSSENLNIPPLSLTSKEEIFTAQVDDTSTNSQEQKKTKINEALQKIAVWLKSNGSCKINLAISTKNGEYYEVTEEKKSEDDIAKSIFQPQSGMYGKSKLERLADDLNDENSRKGEDKTKYSSYKEKFKTRCSNKKGQVIKLQWRGKVSKDSEVKDNTHIEDIEGLVNLWVDEKEDVQNK